MKLDGSNMYNTYNTFTPLHHNYVAHVLEQAAPTCTSTSICIYMYYYTCVHVVTTQHLLIVFIV